MAGWSARVGEGSRRGRWVVSVKVFLIKVQSECS